MSEVGNDIELGLNNEGEDGIDAQLRLNIQDRREPPAQDANGAEHREEPVPRMILLLLALLVIASSWTFISDLSMKPLAGFHVFLLYGSLSTGLLLLVAALPWSPVSPPTINKIAWITALLVHIALGLKMKLPAQS